ncbi:MAG: mechanosensitive ion channel family protein [Bacteroidia bacterium]
MINLRNILSILFFLITSLAAFPQDYPLDQSSPRSTMYKHLYYLQDDNYLPLQAAEVFGSSTEENSKLAIRLKQIYDATGFYFDLSLIPADSSYRDSVNRIHRYNPIADFPGIYLVKKDSIWIYSENSKDATERAYSRVFPFGTELLMNIIPGATNQKFLGIKAWQYVGFFILILLAFILHKIFTWIIEILTRRLIQSSHVSKEFRIAIHKMAIPISYLVLVQVIDWLFPSLMLPPNVAYYFALSFKIIEPIFLTIALYRLVDVFSLIMKARAEKTETSLDDQLVPLFRKTAKVFVIGFGLVYLLNNLNFNLTALIAGVSIGGLAFALAAQDTIKNMFGSLMIFIDRPFQIGDLVSLEGTLGTIEEVGFRSTRVRTPANSLVSVPNGKVVDMVIDNLGMRVYRRFQTNISLTYDTPVELIETYVEGLRQIILSHPQTNKENFEVHLNDMAASSLNVFVNIFFFDEGFSSELKARHEIISEAIRLAEMLKVRFAFPTQTLHMETFPEKTIPDFAYPASAESKEKIMDDYLLAMKQRMVKGSPES